MIATAHSEPGLIDKKKTRSRSSLRSMSTSTVTVAPSSSTPVPIHRNSLAPNSPPPPMPSAPASPLLSSRRSSAQTGGSESPPKSLSAQSSRTTLKNEYKRNADFHALFRSVPESDRLLNDYGCALQKEILLQGRMYISEDHICFNAKIFGWVTNLVVAFAEITDIEKRTTAIFIPNAIQISTAQAKYFFASFLSRDQAYEQIVRLWKLHGGGSSDGNASSLTMVANAPNENEDEDRLSLSSGDDSYDSQSTISEDVQPNDLDDTLKSSSAAFLKPPIATAPMPHPTDPAQVNVVTECKCITEHYTQTVMDQVYTGTLDSIYKLLCHSPFLQGFLTDVEKNTDVQIGAWDGDMTRQITYTKRLTGSIGPRQTKCVLRERVHHLDPDRSITLDTTTQTPDVPSGSNFCVRTRICLTRAGHGQVRVLVTVNVDFSKSSWLKSTIERASIDGQTNYYKALDLAVRDHMQIGTKEVKPHGEHLKKQHRRKRRSRQQHHRRTLSHHEQERRTKSAYDAFLETFSAGAAAGAQWVLDNSRSGPSTGQITAVCMLLMVCINLFMAVKLANVTHELKQVDGVTATSRNYAHPTSKLAAEPTYDDASWDQQSDLLWRRLEAAEGSTSQRIHELEQMIRHAGSTASQLSHSAQRQREQQHQ
ncbi:GRAM domain-domain-containing protein [Syncephalastrum racemosum]|uniref:GRAM domain-domain-containing protein n=1 Tax=Syncephalastrum racemosum TaxID=13706 RepID=A0A1X2HS64_SYNRA|nr:GRAM domain-domain-containing protein [Syncephalastrum racemosum]